MPADWSDVATAVGGGTIATVIAWILGRGDTAKHRRREEIREVTEKYYTEREIEVRLNTLETVLPRVEKKLDDTNEMVTAIHELALGGRLQIKKRD